MGFNFSVAREVDGKLKGENFFTERTHTQECASWKISVCMCQNGIDTGRVAGDGDFFFALTSEMPNEHRLMFEEHLYYRPTDFAIARELARKISEEHGGGTRLMRLLDTLEQNTDIWLGGGW